MPCRTDVSVTWGDTDAGGLIYYPRFFHFVVVGLNDYFAPAVDEGHLMEHLRDEGYVLPAVDAEASFEAPLRAGETAHVETTVTAGDSSIAVDFDVTRESDPGQVASGAVTFVLVDETFDPVSLPSPLRECVRERGDTVE